MLIEKFKKIWETYFWEKLREGSVWEKPAKMS
jgi:hypothetical protein